MSKEPMLKPAMSDIEETLNRLKKASKRLVRALTNITKANERIISREIK